MKFSMKHIIFGSEQIFTEDTAPSWLRFGGLAGSTMDNRWFWNKHVVTLKVGESVGTDFQLITRTE